MTLQSLTDLRPKKGSGKNGNVIKKDWCEILVQRVVKGGPEIQKAAVEALVTTEKKAVDVELLCAMTQMQPNETFDKMKKLAFETLDTSVYGSSEKASNMKTLEEAEKVAEKKVPVLKERHSQAVSSANERNYNLTPDDMKLLLPGGGTIRGLFWGRYHPTEPFFKVTYPCSILTLMLINFSSWISTRKKEKNTEMYSKKEDIRLE